MKIIIIGDKAGYLAVMIRKAAYSCISLDHIDRSFINTRINANDIIIAYPDPKVLHATNIESDSGLVNQAIDDCLLLLKQNNPVCIINPPGLITKIIAPSQTMRLKVVGDRFQIFHLWMKGGLTAVSLPKKKPVLSSINGIPVTIAQAMFEQWKDFFLLHEQTELPF